VGLVRQVSRVHVCGLPLLARVGFFNELRAATCAEAWLEGPLAMAAMCSGVVAATAAGDVDESSLGEVAEIGGPCPLAQVEAGLVKALGRAGVGVGRRWLLRLSRSSSRNGKIH